MKKAFLIFSYILLLGSFSVWPPNVDFAQRIPPTTIDTLSFQRQQIRQLELSNQAKEDSIHANIAYIKKYSKVSFKENPPKVVYKTQVRIQPVPVVVHDTIKKVVYTPVDKSTYYIKSRKWSDSLALEQYKIDSLEKARAYELKHRSIFKKVFGSKKKQANVK